jgi:hypothetical protein
MSSTPALSRFSISFVLGCFVLTCASVSPAQSGRRSPRISTPPPPLAEPESPDPKSTTAPAPKPSLVLNVGMDDNGGFVRFPLKFYTDAMLTIIERLSQDASVKVNDLGNITRGDAVKGAKAEKETFAFVVYLDIKVDSMNPDAFSQNARDAIIEYRVFAPGTAKTATSGFSYARNYEKKVGIPRPNSSGTFDNYLVNMAAKAAAEQILDYFKTHRP